MLKGRVLFGVALTLGLLSGLAMYLAIESHEREARKGWNLVPVVVVSEDLREGTVITDDVLARREVPEQFVTTSVVTPDSLEYIRNQRVLVPLQKGDPLLWSQFETTRATERLSAKVQKKARAVTIAASPATSVGGWIRPNDHVDVIGTFRDPQSNEQVAVTLLENVMVLATGKLTGTHSTQASADGPRDYDNVSLLVVPEEAEMLVLAAELGSLALSLRNEGDLDVLDERGRADIRTLLSGQRTKDLRAKRMRAVQVIRGAAIESEPVTPRF